MRRNIILAVIALSLIATTAMADNIDHRLGFNGRVGFIVPLADSEINGTPFEFSDVGFAVGGGLIYGFGKYFAAEFDVTHVPNQDVKLGGNKVAEANYTDLSLGLQFRLMPENHFVPYIGAGGDFIKGDIEDTTLDWTYGGHANAGLDYFLNNGIALNVDCKAIMAAKSDIMMNGVKVGKFDPMSVVTTFGVRLILPKKWW